VRLSELRIENLRVVSESTLVLPAGWSVFVGPNGAGKTSLLEAVFLLSHGRSFRSASRDTLSRVGGRGFSVFGRIERADGISHRLGLARNNNRLEARVDGADVTLGALVQACAVVCFEPGSHELINGAADGRRRYLDWGVFHVEHEFLDDWRRYQRALRQRNVLLREGAADQELDPWEAEMAASGERLSRYRADYVEQLRPILQEILGTFLGELGEPVLVFEPGWSGPQALSAALRDGRSRDRDRGHTGRGPHRADWSVGFARAPRREHLSRGQEKLCALAFVLAQARLHAVRCGEWPILCFDDLASELDRAHLAVVLEVARNSGAQVLMTGTEVPAALAGAGCDATVFHVEHGCVTP